MNLCEYMEQHTGEKILVWDSDTKRFEFFKFFVYGDGYIDSGVKQCKVIKEISECLKIVKEYSKTECLTVDVNLSEVIERSIESGAMDTLFYDNTLYAIMSEIRYIIKGEGNDKWLAAFVEALRTGVEK